MGAPAGRLLLLLLGLHSLHRLLLGAWRRCRRHSCRRLALWQLSRLGRRRMLPRRAGSALALLQPLRQRQLRVCDFCWVPGLALGSVLFALLSLILRARLCGLLRQRISSGAGRLGVWLAGRLLMR